MRIHLKIMADNVIIPYNHQPMLTGVIHKWLGWNKEHGDVSLYSFSRLENAKAIKNGLKIEKGTYFFFSSCDNNLIKSMITGIQKDPSIFHGLKVCEIIIQEEPDLSNRELFFCSSPIFIKRKNNDKIEHILYMDSRAKDCLRETLLTRMKKAGITDNEFEVYFDSSYLKASTKLIDYNGIKNTYSK